LSDESPNPQPGGTPRGGRPPGSSSRRRRRGRGSRGAGSTTPGGAQQQGGAPQQPRPPGQSRPAGGGGGGSRSGRGSDRRGGGGGDRGGRRGPQPQQAPAVRELEITDDKIFQRLLDGGLDLGEEAVIEAFLYFTGEAPARRVAAQLAEGGYQTFVDPSPPGRWLLEAVRQAVPSPENIAAMGASLRNAARSNSGIYDGWWASEPPEEEEGGLVGLALEEDPQPGQEDDLQVQPD
jgi:hypothetical protein